LNKGTAIHLSWNVRSLYRFFSLLSTAFLTAVEKTSKKLRVFWADGFRFSLPALLRGCAKGSGCAGALKTA
jgi:hypothetical protein